MKWIKRILGITQLEKDLKQKQLFIEQLQNTNSHLLEEINNFKSLINVGVDLHVYNSKENWAVVCIQGKPDYIKFVSLSNREVNDVVRFLRNFDSKNVTIDAPRYVDKRRFLNYY